jgi:hypothetical protein
MASASPFRRPAFITPLMREDLLESGQVFPRDELLRRVLSAFWRDCCSPARFSRAPAPVVELAGNASSAGGAVDRVRAWWLLNDGIIEEAEGPHSERLRLFFGGIGRLGMLWPRYEFRVQAEPFEVQMSFHQEPLVGRGHRTRLEVEPDGRVRVSGQEPWWGK